jgi:putative Mg2+ transporter-C (MgtC) family protein
MASCALTIFGGYSNYWYGGHSLATLIPDPTRVVQGIVTGVGFLGAGVIMKDGFSISGLSTAASIWMCSAIGVLIGVGFYMAGISLALLSVGSMIFIPKLEIFLPHKKAIVVTLKFKEGFVPNEIALRGLALERGYNIPLNGISVNMKENCLEWHYVALAIPRKRVATITEMSNELALFEGISDFNLCPSRH